MSSVDVSDRVRAGGRDRLRHDRQRRCAAGDGTVLADGGFHAGAESSFALRGYAVDSKQAAARIVALAMIADGRVSRAEFDVLKQGGYEAAGIAPAHLREALQDLCDDLLRGAAERGSQACSVEPDAIARIMGEIDAQELRRCLAAVCLRVASADRHLSRGEAQLLLQVFEHWGRCDEPARAPVRRIDEPPRHRMRAD